MIPLLKVGEYDVPDDLVYSKEHEWVRKTEANRLVIGVTDYAAKMLNDVIYVTLPQVNAELKFMQALGSLESIKSVSDVYSPLSGKVLKVNESLAKHPELVNKSPYGEGWLIELAPSKFDEEVKQLLTAEKYSILIKG